MVWTKEAFAITYHVMLDFDTGDDRSSIDTLKADDFLQLFASFAYTTPSHTDESPRARVVFIVPEGIHDIVTLEALLRYLQDKFPHADASCKNADRIYYGSKGCKGWGNWSLLPLSLVESFVDEQLEKEKQARKAEVPEGYQRVTIETRGDHKNYVMRAVESEVERISSAAEGTGDRHRSLYEAALKLGGIAKSAWGGRYIDEGTITNLLMGAASANGYLQKYGETTTLRAITDGLKVASPRPKPSVTGIIPKAYMLA